MALKIISDIDFVIFWVDGADPEWKTAFESYAPRTHADTRVSRYRDWDNLHYLFRSIERFTPWVRTIHFVTWGHLPEWLDTSHPKLHIVNHQDFIDSTFLPVFSSHPLEISMHNIKGLSEKFVYLNDDLFFTRATPPERFFRDGLPCDALICNALSSSEGVGHFVLNNLEILNRHFDKRVCMRRLFLKWFQPAYGLDNLRNIALSPWPRFTGFIDPHMPQPFLKSTFKEVWEKEKDVLVQTMYSRFRECSNVNQYLFRYWQLAKGAFHPVSMKDTMYVDLTMEALKEGRVTKPIVNQTYKMVALNDSESITTQEALEEAKAILKHAFEQILPEKSSYEI